MKFTNRKLRGLWLNHDGSIKCQVDEGDIVFSDGKIDHHGFEVYNARDDSVSHPETEIQAMTRFYRIGMEFETA